MNMELNYSGAKTIEEARAIKKAYWDYLNSLSWREITREEFERQVTAIRERNRKRNEQQGGEDDTAVPV